MVDSVLNFFDNHIDTTSIVDGYSAILSLQEMGPDKFFEFAESTIEFFSDDIQTRNTEYTFLADSKLSGMPLYCNAASCRQEYLSKLAMFALLYTDVTYVVNPFAYALDRTDNIEQLISEFSIAIFSAIFLAPLLEKGIVKFTDAEADNLCEECLDKVFSEKKLIASFPELALDKLYNSSTLEVKKIRGKKCILIHYDQIHDEHELIIQLNRKMGKKFKVGQPITKKTARDIKVFGHQIDNLTYDFFIRNIFAHKRSANNIMCSPVEYGIVNSLSGHDFVNSGFEVKYPLLLSRRMIDAVKVRENEWHHLDKFRKAIREIKNNGTLTPREITKISNGEFGQIKTVLERANNQAKGLLLEAGIFSCVSIAGAIGTAGIAPFLSGAAALLGNGHATKKVAEAIRTKVIVPDEALDANFYYAWKMSKVLSGS